MTATSAASPATAADDAPVVPSAAGGVREVTGGVPTLGAGDASPAAGQPGAGGAPGASG